MTPLPGCTSMNILSVLKCEQSMTIDELRLAYKDDFGIELTVENLNELYDCEYDTIPEALKHGLQDYALFGVSRHYGNRVTYLSKNKTTAAQRRRDLYIRVKEAIALLIKLREVIYKDELMENIFSRYGVVLNIETLKQIYGEGDGYRQIFARGLKDIAHVTVVQLERGITFSFHCKGKPCGLSLSRADNLKQNVVIHDGCAGYDDPLMEFPELKESVSWHRISRDRYRRVAENIRSRWRLNWDDARHVTLCVGGGAIYGPATVEDVFEDVKDLALSIREKAPNCKMCLWKLPVHLPTEYAKKAIELNELFKTLRRKPIGLTMDESYASNKVGLDDLKDWRSNIGPGKFNSDIMKFWLLEYVSRQN